MRTVTSVNVNGIRAAAGKGLVRWLAGTAADVVCLQGTRAQLEEVPPEMLAGWHVSHGPCASARGRNGVAVLTREPPQAVRVGISTAEFDDAHAVSAVVERAPSHGERWSDHAPVTAVYGS